MKICKLLLLLILIAPFAGLQAQVQWTDFEDLADSLRQEKKPILVFIHADWCSYCKLQDRSTFVKPAVVQTLKNYYCLRLNAEEQEEIEFLNRTYHFEATGYQTGRHQLAQLLGAVEGQLSLPTTLVLDQQLRLVQRETSYLDPEIFLEWLD